MQYRNYYLVYGNKKGHISRSEIYTPAETNAPPLLLSAHVLMVEET
jgi:hypothetical protein